MCFSPAASFTASAVLGATGANAVTQTRGIAQKVLACVPILFAMQQFSEGVLWLSLMRPQWAYLKQGSMYVFLVFAQVIWSLYVPLAMFLFEKHKKRRRAMAVLLATNNTQTCYTL